MRPAAKRTETAHPPLGAPVPLNALPPGGRAVVINLAGGRGLVGRMTCMGFTPGVEILMVQNYGFGPLIASIRGCRVALGRSEAGKVYVRVLAAG